MPAGRLVQQFRRMAPMAAAASQRQRAMTPRRPMAPMRAMPGDRPSPDPELLALLQQQAGNSAVTQFMAEDDRADDDAAVAHTAVEDSPPIAASREGNALAGADTSELLGGLLGRVPTDPHAAAQVGKLSKAELFAFGFGGNILQELVAASAGEEAGISHRTMKAMARGMAADEAMDYAVPIDHLPGQ